MKNIKKHYHIKATAEDIFTALTNPLTIEIWTGGEAPLHAGRRPARGDRRAAAAVL